MIRSKTTTLRRSFKFQTLLPPLQMALQVVIGCFGVYMTVTGSTSPIQTSYSFLLTMNSGWTTSAKLRQTLISFVARELNSTYTAALKNAALKFPSPEAIDYAIKQGFIRLDNEIIHDS